MAIFACQAYPNGHVCLSNLVLMFNRTIPRTISQELLRQNGHIFPAVLSEPYSAATPGQRDGDPATFVGCLQSEDLNAEGSILG